MAPSSRPSRAPKRGKNAPKKPAKNTGGTPAPYVPPTEATEPQLLILEGLAALTVDGVPPGDTELARHLGYADHTGVIKPLQKLERLGLIVPVPRLIKYGYALTDAGRRKLSR